MCIIDYAFGWNIFDSNGIQHIKKHGKSNTIERLENKNCSPKTNQSERQPKRPVKDFTSKPPDCWQWKILKLTSDGIPKQSVKICKLESLMHNKFIKETSTPSKKARTSPSIQSKSQLSKNSSKYYFFRHRLSIWLLLLCVSCR